MGFRKHIREIERMVSQQTDAYDIRRTKGGHIAIVIGCGPRRERVIVPGTPSDYRSILNAKSQVRQIVRSMAPAAC